MNNFLDFPLQLRSKQKVHNEYILIRDKHGEPFIVAKGEQHNSFDPFKTTEIMPSLISYVERVITANDLGETSGEKYAKFIIEWIKQWGYLTVQPCRTEDGEKYYCQSVIDFNKKAGEIYFLWNLYKDITNKNLNGLISKIGKINGEITIENYQNAGMYYLAENIEKNLGLNIINSNLYLSDLQIKNINGENVLDFTPGINFNNLLNVLYMQFLIYLKSDKIKICPGCNKPFEVTRPDKKYCSKSCKDLMNMKKYRQKQKGYA